MGPALEPAAHGLHPRPRALLSSRRALDPGALGRRDVDPCSTPMPTPRGRRRAATRTNRGNTRSMVSEAKRGARDCARTFPLRAGEAGVKLERGVDDP